MFRHLGTHRRLQPVGLLPSVSPINVFMIKEVKQNSTDIRTFWRDWKPKGCIEEFGNPSKGN